MRFLNKIFVKNSHKDPVCGMGTSDKIVSQFGGQDYFFCSAHCKQEFDSNPEKYARGK